MMVQGEKNIKKKAKVFIFIGKWFGILVLCLLGILLLAHLGLHYGAHVAQIGESTRTHWEWWLLLRIAIYAVSGFLLYQIYRRGSSEHRATFYRVTRAAVIAVVVVEFVNFMQIIVGG